MKLMVGWASTQTRFSKATASGCFSVPSDHSLEWTIGYIVTCITAVRWREHAFGVALGRVPALLPFPPPSLPTPTPAAHTYILRQDSCRK